MAFTLFYVSILFWLLLWDTRWQVAAGRSPPLPPFLFLPNRQETCLQTVISIWKCCWVCTHTHHTPHVCCEYYFLCVVGADEQRAQRQEVIARNVNTVVLNIAGHESPCILMIICNLINIGAPFLRGMCTYIILI